jgi:hypothetical protein
MYSMWSYEGGGGGRKIKTERRKKSGWAHVV